MLPKKLLIITGLSGSGKSSALHLLEDQGFFTVDNIPVGMLPQHPKALENGVAAVIDVRSLDLPDCLPRVLDDLKQKGVNVQILFLEASEDVLLRRYSLTRRRHPLGFMNSLLEGIGLERKQLAQFRRIADRIIDTSALSRSSRSWRAIRPDCR